ncbi:hypothetical protein V6N13_092432 [Hibiscus sabdariffa]|uniref:Uncharacterized protein n=1 Tax=Hibiscus sabdariffa TaxID=183260 RepID=A0ABR2CCA8_9ROSI
MKTVDAASPTVVVFTHPDIIVFVKESEGSKTIGTVLGLVAVESSDPVNFILKKIQRVVRFSVPIQLSEQEKRNSSVERSLRRCSVLFNQLWEVHDVLNYAWSHGA